MTVLSAH